MPDLGAGPGRAGRAPPRPPALLDEPADALEHARLLFVAVGTPPTYSGDADLSAVHAVVDAMPAVRPSRAGHEVDGAGRHGRDDQAALRRAGQGLLLRLLPRVPQGGLGGQGLPAPGPRRRRRRRRLGRRRGRRPLRAARRAARAHRHQERGDGQARLQRVPGHEDLLHQRDRQRLRGDRRRRRRGRQGHGPGRPDRPEVPAGRDRLRRLLLPEGRHGAQAARRQLGLPLPAAQLGDRGQRAPEAARDGQAREAPRPARGQGDRAARPRLQAQHRRHARGQLARALGAPAGRRGARAGLRPGRRGGGAQADPGRRVHGLGDGGRRGRRRGRARDRVARVRRARPRRAGGRDARRPAGRRAQLPRSPDGPRRRAGLRGHRPPAQRPWPGAGPDRR